MHRLLDPVRPSRVRASRYAREGVGPGRGDQPVAQPSGPLGRDRVAAGQPDLRAGALRRLRCHVQVVVPVVAPFEGERPVGPRPPDDLDALLHQPSPVAPIDAEHVELLQLVPEAEAQPEPASRQEIDDRGLLGHVERVVQRQQEHGRPDGDPLGPGRDGGGHGEGGREVRVVDEVVLGQPDHVEAEGLHRLDVREGLGVDLGVGDARRGRVAQVVQDTELHGALPPQASDASSASIGERTASPSRMACRLSRITWPGRGAASSAWRPGRTRSGERPAHAATRQANS